MSTVQWMHYCIPPATYTTDVTFKLKTDVTSMTRCEQVLDLCITQTGIPEIIQKKCAKDVNCTWAYPGVQNSKKNKGTGQPTNISSQWGTTTIHQALNVQLVDNAFLS